MPHRFPVTYQIRATPAAIEARARAIAVEQSIEMPPDAVTDTAILRDIVPEIAGITEEGPGLFRVVLNFAAETVGADIGQWLNMLFGNTSLHDDVTLIDAAAPPAIAAAYPGPRHGLAGLRARVEAGRRPLAASAIKPQGLPPERLADLAYRFALGGLDYVKDDHGLANQAYAPFARRLSACAAAIHRAAASTGHATRYVPSITGTLDMMRVQCRLAWDEGVDTVMIAPMLAGPANAAALISEFPALAFFAHPTFGGIARIAPQFLIGRLFRLLGADAVIFPNTGGRFGYSEATCRALAAAARDPAGPGAPAAPTPAGGITAERVPAVLDFYGPDTMLLVGGSLLAARDRLTEAAAAFAAQLHTRTA